MKKFGIPTLLAALAVMSLAPRASAVLVTVNYTGDNIVGAWYKDGAGPVNLGALGPNASDWTVKDTATLDLAPDSYQIIFRVQNLGA